MIRNTLVFSLLVVAFSARSFNLETHALVTDTGTARSALGLNSAELEARYGFDRLSPASPFSNLSNVSCVFPSAIAASSFDAYLDANGSYLETSTDPFQNVFGRCPTLFEQRSMPPLFTGLIASPSLGMTPWLRVRGWLMRGAIREDDYQSTKYDNPTLIPDVDLWNDSFRSLGHFYEPVANNTGISFLGISVGKRSPAWALGVADTSAWQTNSEIDVLRGNHFSYADARKMMFLALTYKAASPTSTDGRRDFNLRLNMWATMFKAIGHVIHLLQDGAQPQHVRGEPHTLLCNGNLAEDQGVQSPLSTRTFENFTNFRITYRWDITLGSPTDYSFSNLCDDSKWLNMFNDARRAETGQDAPADVQVWSSSTYPIPQFSVQRKFFTTRVEDVNINDRRGLMDYSNRGFFTEGGFRQPTNNSSFASPPPLNDPSYSVGVPQTTFIPGLGMISTRSLLWRVPDKVAPNFPDEGLSTDGKAAIVSRNLFGAFSGNTKPYMTLANYVQVADMVVPRAIAYTTGMINFFFRGKLTIDPISQRVFAVMNQGDPHTMNADGYPIRTSNGQIFGFEKIRLRVRNSTDPITESGTNNVVPQGVGNGKLVAVARYHRNPCYKPDLTGERIVDFNNTLTEPNCPQGLRTNYQEISVSAPLTITDNTDLPLGTTVAASVEKVFDFAADPIPVNATDLFIQVVYRGQLGQETDGIAVGIIDTQEPTIVGTWNNTDHYYSNVGFNWLIQNGTNFAHRGIDSLSICSGGGLSSSVLLYRYASPQDGFNISFLNGTLNPGIVRLALVNAKFPTMSNQQAYRMVPALNAPPFMQQRSTQSRGQLRQASQEIFTSAIPLPAPVQCQMAEPTNTPFWCFDPIKRRRGQPIGDALQPMYFATGGGSDATDVDLPPALPVYSGLRPVVGGTVNFNTDAILMACPAPQQ